MLIARYPREQWEIHTNLGEMARFWLSRHVMFRELSVAIGDITTQFRAGHLPAAEFAQQFVPRLQFMLDQSTSITRLKICTISRFSRPPKHVLRLALTCSRAITITFTPRWLVPQSPRMLFCRHCGREAMRCAAAAKIMPH